MARSAGLISLRYKVEDDRANLTSKTAYSGKISFHGVISEGHTSVAELTKFPVQGGFEVSNHVVKKNRKVEIEGIITDTILPGQVEYPARNNSKFVFRLINQIVNNGIMCYVITNLGVYKPVVFKSFTTKQGVGSLDSMKFKLVGEELILGNGRNSSGPKPVEFEVVPEEEYQALYDKLVCNGIEVPEGAELSRAKVGPAESFTMGATTYINKGKDFLGISTMETQDSGVLGVIPEENTSGGLPISSAEAKEFNIGACLKEGAESAASDLVSEKVDTTLGKLEEGLYGAKTDIVNMGGPIAAPFLEAGLDCVVAFAADALTENEVDECGNPIPNTGLPTANDVIGGISDTGVAVAQDLIKIASPF